MEMRRLVGKVWASGEVRRSDETLAVVISALVACGMGWSMRASMRASCQWWVRPVALIQWSRG